MIRPMVQKGAFPVDASIVVIVLAVALILLVGCGGSTPPPASTSVTSATVAGPQAPGNEQLGSVRIAELEDERDRALRKASDAQALAASTRERSEKALRALAVRNDFEDAMWSKLDRIDARMKAIRFEAARLGADARFRVNKRLEPLAERRNTAERELHRIHSVPVADWSSFASDVELTINAVARDVETIEMKP